MANNLPTPIRCKLENPFSFRFNFLIAGAILKSYITTQSTQVILLNMYNEAAGILKWEPIRVSIVLPCSMNMVCAWAYADVYIIAVAHMGTIQINILTSSTHTTPLLESRVPKLLTKKNQLKNELFHLLSFELL